MKSRNQMRREKRKQKRQASAEQAPAEAAVSSGASADTSGAAAEAAAPASAPSVPAEEKVREPSSGEKAAPRSSVTMLARSYDWVTESNPLFGMYQQISSRFKRPRSTTTHDDDDGDDDDGDGDDGDGDKIIESHDRVEEPQDESKEILSNKRRRKEQKPKLTDLKKLTRRPELVDWYDADAQDPEFLVYLKSLPYAVQVPSNWRNRTDIPNFPPQPAYELPQNVADTGIMDMRDPNAVEANSKPGRLDVDYERMHSAFFEHEQTPRLTAYGEVRDPKLRTLAFKPKRSPTTSQFKPGSISARLREALGLGPDDDVPWAEAMKKHGLPPGYKHHEQAHIVRLWGAPV